MQTIDLPTVQHVTIAYETASLGERMLAILIDLAIVGIGYLIFALSITELFDLNWDGFQAIVLGLVLPLLVFILYHFLFELLWHGQGPGKRALHIQVVRLDGNPITPGDYLLRSMFYFLDLFTSLGILGGLLIYASPKQQRLGDLLAGTGVIKIKSSGQFLLSDILKISSLEDYEPVYPDVRQFTETDMLLIKNTLMRTQRYPNAVNKQLLIDLAGKLARQLEVQEKALPPEQFLKTLIRDYIVLTR
ncbi:MAG: RDD family protein [Bacteroidota bacterium]